MNKLKNIYDEIYDEKKTHGTSGEKYHVVEKNPLENCFRARGACLCLHGCPVSHSVDTHSPSFTLHSAIMLIPLIYMKKREQQLRYSDRSRGSLKDRSIVLCSDSPR